MGVLRVDRDPGLLTNIRMAAEIATALAFLTDRRLALPLDEPMGGAPVSALSAQQAGRPAYFHDLFEVPVDLVYPDEWATLETQRTEVISWDDAGRLVCVCDDDIDLTTPNAIDFCNGRTQIVRPPVSDAPVVHLSGRLLSFYSYFFLARPARMRQIRAVIRGLRPRPAYGAFGAAVARSLGQYNAAHIRRSDLTAGIPAYQTVTPVDVADTLADVLPTNETLLVCSEVSHDDEFFDPLRSQFDDIVFANDTILGQPGFFDLPRHEDNVLGLLTQEVATRASRFVGTIGSTFTAVIQRQRRFRDPGEKFLFTADFTPPGTRFEHGEFLEIEDGCYSWNRISYAMDPEPLAWFREWPEAT